MRSPSSYVPSLRSFVQPRLHGISRHATRSHGSATIRRNELHRAGPLQHVAVGALYLSRDPRTAYREFAQANETDGDDGCVLSVARVTVGWMVDLMLPAERLQWGVTEGDLRSDDLTRCQQVADRIARAGAEGILWPSATGQGESLAVFLDQLGAGSSVRLINVVELPSDLRDDEDPRLAAIPRTIDSK